MVGVDLASVTLDSQFRYLSGLLLGIGLAFLGLIPDIGRRGSAFRLLTFLVFIGGLARLVALVRSGMPEPAMRFALVMELGVTPLLCLWQAMIAERPRN